MFNTKKGVLIGIYTYQSNRDNVAYRKIFRGVVYISLWRIIC